MAYTKYSLTPANNNAAPPDGAPEGMLPSAVNDTMRDMMAQIRDVGDGIRGGTYTMTAPVITGGSITGVALSGNTFTSPVISGGSINNTPIGASTANTGAFTTLSASSTISGTGFTNYFASPPAIGGTAAAAGNFTTLGATGVATFSAGTVSLPAITTTGDTNTGIYFPAADTIAFTEGGVESMRIDSTGNVGIGTSSPASRLSMFSATGNTNGIQLSAAGWNAIGRLGLNGTSGGQLILSGNWNAETNTVDTASNATAYVNVSAEGGVVVFGTGGVNTVPSERMRISSAGEVLVGLTSTLDQAKVAISYDNGLNQGLIIANTASGTADAVRFKVNGSTVGSINTSTTATLYNTSSDYRLKDNIVNAPSGNIDSIKVRSFDWKSDGSHIQYGFIAQELVEVAPYAVHQPQDPEEMMAVDYSKLVPMMIKEIQDLKQRIKILENK